jgi:hypothetical protein
MWNRTTQRALRHFLIIAGDAKIITRSNCGKLGVTD